MLVLGNCFAERRSHAHATWNAQKVTSETGCYIVSSTIASCMYISTGGYPSRSRMCKPAYPCDYLCISVSSLLSSQNEAPNCIGQLRTTEKAAQCYKAHLTAQRGTKQIT